MIATTLLKRLEDCMWQMLANVKIMEKSVFSMKSMFDDVSLFGISKTHESYIPVFSVLGRPWKTSLGFQVT
jgi:hypothetical protein